LLVGHLEEEEVGELLDVVAVGEAVVAEDVAIVPLLLNTFSSSPGAGLPPEKGNDIVVIQRGS
jgi:hypothetical protein